MFKWNISLTFSCQKMKAKTKIKNKPKNTDMGFPSVYCEYVLLPVVNKEAILANGLAE